MCFTSIHSYLPLQFGVAPSHEREPSHGSSDTRRDRSFPAPARRHGEILEGHERPVQAPRPTDGPTRHVPPGRPRAVRQGPIRHGRAHPLIGHPTSRQADVGRGQEPASTVTAQPLAVDGARPAVEWVAALPRDWTTLAERYVLHVIACDSYDGRTSRPGLENLAAWTGMHRSSVAEVVNRLLRPSNHRPALLARTSSAGRNRSEYRLLQPSGQHDRPTVVQ